MNSKSPVSAPLPNSSGCKATFRVSSEEAGMNVSPLSNTYISSLSPKEHKAYLIAKSHLDTSFDIEKSIGYKQFLQNNNDSSR